MRPPTHLSPTTLPPTLYTTPDPQTLLTTHIQATHPPRKTAILVDMYIAALQFAQEKWGHNDTLKIAALIGIVEGTFERIIGIFTHLRKEKRGS